MKEQGIKLDLYNYDLPQHESCPYILTSPRSLEACKRLGIKPVELLQKSREEFQAAHPEMSLEEALIAYHRQERQRIKRLREARELRDSLLVAEERRARQEETGAGPSSREPTESPQRRPRSEGEKGEQESSEQEKEEEDKEEEGSGSSSSAPSLARQESDGSSAASSKDQKEQENFARSLARRQSSTSSWEGVKKKVPREESTGEDSHDKDVLTEKSEEEGTEREEKYDSEGVKEDPRKVRSQERSDIGASTSRLTVPAAQGPGPPSGASSQGQKRGPPTPGTARRSKTGAPRPSSAQRAKQGSSRPPFNLTPKSLTSKETSEGPSTIFSRIPGAPYRAASTLKPGGHRKRPASATPKSSSGIPKPAVHIQQPKQLTFKGPNTGKDAAPSALRPSSSQPRLLSRGSGTWPGNSSNVASSHSSTPHRPRITWASTPSRHHRERCERADARWSMTAPGSVKRPPLSCRSRNTSAGSSTGALPLIGLTLRRRSSDSTTSLASSLSEADVHEIIVDPPGTDSDEGTPSANSAAECDRLHVGIPGVPGARNDKRSLSPCRFEPRLPSVSVIGPGGTWSPRSDTTTITPLSTPRLSRRRAPTAARAPCPKTPTRRRLGGHRRVSSARPAKSGLPPAKLSYTGSLDEIAGMRAERAASMGLSVGSSSLEIPRPHSAASSVASSNCPTYRLSRPPSGLSRGRPKRRPASAMGNTPRSDTWSPRLMPNHRSISTVSLADSQILSRFMDGLENTEVPARDLRILEMLAMKHEKLYAEEQRSHLAHQAWVLQKEKEQKEAAAQWAEWRAHVNEKRRQENEENERRWKKNQELYLQSQEKLAQLIYGKERRAREVLAEQQDARVRRLDERRAAESARKAAQESALKAKEEAEERKRQYLIQLWDRQQQLVEQRRREREEFFRKRVEDGNSAEAEKNELRRAQVEARAEALLDAMRNNMEDRLRRADQNLRMLNEVKGDSLRRQRDERERRRMAVRALHHQLEASMLQWRQHVLTRQMETMAAAENRQEQFLHSRANRIHADRTLRMSHQQELLQMVLAREEAELLMAKKKLEAKDMRSQEVSRERDRQVAMAKNTAMTTASLRENLRKKLAPETFDKVVARANLELRIENRPPATSSVGTRSHIFLG